MKHIKKFNENFSTKEGEITITMNDVRETKHNLGDGDSFLKEYSWSEDQILIARPGYKSFLESSREDIGQGLLEYFLDLEDEFMVDVEVDKILLDHWSIRILTLEGFGVGDLKDLLISISGIIKRMKSIGDFTPGSISRIGTDTMKRAKWGSIEGIGRAWYGFGDLDITDPVAIFGSLMSRGEFRALYPQEIRGMSIWMDFLPRQ